VSTFVAVTAAIGAAAAFGTASAVQHAAAHAQTGGGRVDVGGLGRLLVDRRWLLGIGADAIGLALQVLALSAGPVSLVQPLHVLGLLVALPVGTALGGPRATRRALAAAGLLVAGLGGFLLLVGDPGAGRSPARGTSLALSLALLAASGLTVGLTRRRSATVRAVAHGLASAALYALTAVLLRVLSLRLSAGGAHALTHASGFVPLACLLVVGAVGIAIAQAGFQVGPLAASLPAQTAADPLIAVLLGASVLGEHVNHHGPVLVAYAAAFIAVVAAARELARIEHPVDGSPP
jgi:hypothetical protein